MSHEKKDLIRLSAFVALASMLQIGESFLPQIIPGLKIGFANIVTIIVLFKYCARDAIMVSVLRTVVSSIIIGTFLSPGFVISFCSALFSSVLMSVAFKSKWFSVYGISILGAISHNIMQLFVVYLLFINQTTIFRFLPIVVFLSLFTGLVTGMFANKVMARIANRI